MKLFIAQMFVILTGNSLCRDGLNLWLILTSVSRKTPCLFSVFLFSFLHCCNISKDAVILSSFQKIPLKDFSSEVRANLDIDKFVKEAVVLLDAEGSTLEDIIEGMLHRIFSHPDASEETKDIEALSNEAKRALFMQASCLSYTCECQLKK